MSADETASVAAPGPWRGQWVAERLDVRLTTEHSPIDMELSDLVGLAVRRNPRRAHLLVSTVLGKHWPADPRLVLGSGLLLGVLVRRRLGGAAVGDALLTAGERVQARTSLRDALAGDAAAARTLVQRARELAASTPEVPAAVVLGYAETATALGHAVADALNGTTLHSTRRVVPGATAAGAFDEAHSHAVRHLLLPEDPALLGRTGALVLVDDEFSTGATLENTLVALHRDHPRNHYVVAALVDLRGPQDRARMERLAADLGTRIDVVALATGRVDLPADVLGRGTALVAEVGARSASTAPTATLTKAASAPVSHVPRVQVPSPAGLRDGGRHGFTPADRLRLEAHLELVAEHVQPQVGGAGPVHVLGFEELMYAPLRLAERLADLLPDRAVTFSTTTRSPVLPVEAADYAIRSALTFPAHDDFDDGPGDRYVYNLADTGMDQGCVVLVVDSAGDTAVLRGADGLLTQLTAAAARVVLVVLRDYRPGRGSLPEPLRGPVFGSYPPDDVVWLLTDLSSVELEAPVEEREEAIQSGGGHYAESLPIEYQPTTGYQALFTTALDESAARVAHAVGVVTERVLQTRGPEAVLVSLARAGTPVGVLMRRWARWRHGLEVPHYAVSIVRGRGIDHVALRHLATHHDPAAVMFVDGWTGKGAITRELDDSISTANTLLGTAFSPQMAVLADTGGCVDIFGTRSDYLIPTACLNSTVSGLVSRTVLNPDLIGPDDFHGAKFYADLASADVSMDFVETVVGCFDKVREAVDQELAGSSAVDTRPTWVGWAAAERVGAAYGIDDVNLVKPGVGETTRVLLRRVPWKILVRPGATAGLRHVLVLAEQRGVDVVDLPEALADIPYNCVGLIHPRFTRGATGADGRAASGAGPGLA